MGFRWGFIYSSAFTVLPVSVIVSLLVAPHARAFWMVAVNNSCHSVLLGLLVLWLWPEHTHVVLRGIDGVQPETFGMKADLLNNRPGSLDDGVDMPRTDGLEDTDPSGGFMMRQRTSPSQAHAVPRQMIKPFSLIS